MWKLGNKHGRGEAKFTNGEIYHGIWDNDFPQKAFYLYTPKNNTVYQGEINDYKADGKGR